jgi:phage shock protein A
MGMFTRLRDIINANIQAILDRAEDPEKILNLMLAEMDDTLVELKAQCAAAMAQVRLYGRAVEEARTRSEGWAARARQAVERERDDLAREALLEKRRYAGRAEALAVEASQAEATVEQYRADIAELEAKIRQTRERRANLVQRHTHARTRRRAQETIRRVDTSDVEIRMTQFEKRVDRMEAEADLVNFGVTDKTELESRFDAMVGDEQVERELEAIRAEVHSARTR